MTTSRLHGSMQGKGALQEPRAERFQRLAAQCSLPAPTEIRHTLQGRSSASQRLLALLLVISMLRPCQTLQRRTQQLRQRMRLRCSLPWARPAWGRTSVARPTHGERLASPWLTQTSVHRRVLRGWAHPGARLVESSPARSAGQDPAGCQGREMGPPPAPPHSTCGKLQRRLEDGRRVPAK